jgi:outer membrane lipoprotein-sorting protein
MKRFLFAISGFLALASILTANAEDAGSILKKTSSVYRGLRSYSQSANVTDVFKSGKLRMTFGSTTKLAYRSPNLLLVTLSNPKLGTLAAASDGRQEILYASMAKRYRRQAAPPNVSEFVKTLGTLGIASAMDSLYFLQGQAADNGATGLKLIKTTKLNGHDCYQITGALKAGLIPQHSKGQVTLWVDKNTGLLQKVMFDMTNVTRFLPAKKKVKGRYVPVMVKVTGGETLVQEIEKNAINPDLPDSTFVYPLPKDAVEQNYR